jgi:transmembrane sensor
MKRIDFEDLGAYLRADPAAWNTDAAWLRMRARMRPSRVRAIRIAATIIIALGLGVVWQLRDRAVTYQTAVGERRTVQLADGTVVDLAATSTLRVVDMSRALRVVELDGQGFFTVTHNSARPFIVRARQAETTVLGTSFDVSAYRDAAGLDVVVATGRVQVRDTRTHRSVILEPNQAVHLEAGRLTVFSTVASDAASWRRGQLSFRNARFGDVANALQRWYAAKITIADPALADARVNVFLPQQSLAEVLDLLAATLDARYERADNLITFYRK